LISLAQHDSPLEKWSSDMSDLFWLTDAQMARLEPFFRKRRLRLAVTHKFGAAN
jgi:hypothetical protein